MKLENQVCTLEQAKRLKELGIDQLASQYSFVRVFVEEKDGADQYDIVLWHREMFNMWVEEFSNDERLEERENYSAFTAAELGQALGHGFHSYISQGDNAWTCLSNDLIFVCFAPSEAQARAKALIHMLESGKMTAAEVNLRIAA